MTNGHSDEVVSRTGRTVALGGVSGIALAVALQMGLAGAANAQEAGVAAGVEEVVVTASRVSRSGFTAPTPVTTIGQDQLNTRAPTTMGEVLSGIPSFRPSSSPQTSGVTSRNGGIISADLRGLGSDRTLVLVNGRRYVPQTPSGTVDMKQIPTLMVQNVEVVTGGASAAWGSDAVAGVVNFILKDRVEGVQGTIQYGQSELNDNIEYRASLATGGTWGDGRMRAIVGADYMLNLGIASQYTRDWGRQEVGIHTNAAFATNGQPQYIIAPNSGITNMTQGGLVVSGPLRGLAFLPNGSTYQYQFGETYGTTMIGGSKDGQNPNLDSNLGQPIESLSVMTKIDFDLTDAITLFFEGGATRTKTKGASQEPRDRGNLVVQRDNAFLPDAVRARMLALNLTTLTIGRTSEDTGAIQLAAQTKTYRGVVGARGRLFGTWTWDTYYQYGRDLYDLTFGPNNRNQANYARAVDAVRAPNGQIVCRSTLTAPTNGCIPVNVFGDGNLKLNSYVHGSATVDQMIEQHVAAFNVQGEPFSTWAGPVSVATGVEYRKDSIDAPTDAVSQQVNPNGSVGGWILGNQLPIKGSINVKEIYGEAVVPLSQAGTALGALDLNAAIRRTDYSISGGVTTWKIGGTWEPIDDIRFRMTRSRDIRAPNLSEFYQAGGSSNTNVFDPVAGGQVQVREVAQGNLNLVPERANTFTGGVVLQPRFAPRLALSADYFNIKVDDVIGSIGAPVAVQGCQAGDPVFCQSVVFNPNGSIAFVIAQQLNLDQLRTSGIDYEVQYSMPAFGGLFQFRGLLTHTLELVTVQSNGPVQRLGRLSGHLRVFGVPKYRGNFDFRYSRGPWSTNMQVRYIGAGVFNPDLTEGAGRANTINKNDVSAFVYFNWGAQYNFEVRGKPLELYGLVNNVLDTDPPWLPSGAAGGTNESSSNAGQGYDLIGRNYRVGLRFRF